MTTENNEQQTSQAADTAASTTTAAAAPGGAPATEQTTQGAAQQAQTAAPAEPKSPLEAVKAVMDRGRAADAKAAGATTSATTQTQAAGAQQQGRQQQQQAAGDGRLTDEEFKALPEKAQKRFHALFRESQTFKANFEKQQPVVQAWNDLQGWARKANISEDEFTFGLQFIANVRNNPAQAWDMLQPVLQVLQRHVGEVLPQDLQAEVDAGTLTRERAQELAKTRAERARLQEQERRHGAEEQQRLEAERQRTFTAEVTRAISGYESQWKGSDPDYPKKSQRVWERMQSIMAAEGRPANPAAAVVLIKRARKEVEDWMGTFIPPAKPKETLPAGGSAAQTRIDPKSPLEAAKLGLASLKAA